MDIVKEKLERFQRLGFNDPQLLQTLGLVVAALVVIFITVKVLSRKKKTKGDSVLLLGDTNTGKTLLFLQLVHNVQPPTQASMKEGDGIYKFTDNGRSKSIKVVDLPGHLRLRSRVNALLRTALGIVFLIDSADFKEKASQVASYLYDVLVDKTVNKQDIPILILLNKRDLENADPGNVIKSRLERELTDLRRTRHAMPKAHASKEDDEDNIYLGVENKPFTFDQLSLDVTFGTASVKNKDIEEVTSFIAKMV